MVRTGPAIGVVAQLGALGVLAGTVGLTVTGWLVGLGCALGGYALLGAGLVRYRATGWGPADWVTLARATVVVAVAALVADTVARPGPDAVVLTLASTALVLDGVDGRVARRTHTASAFGARFDLETDAFLILVLSVAAARSVGEWVLAIGLLRYAFGAIRCALPQLRGTPPPRYWCKVVAAIQGVALAIGIAGVLPGAVTGAVLTIALLLLAESFGRELCWLWRHARADPESQSVEPRLLVVAQ